MGGGNRRSNAVSHVEFDEDGPVVDASLVADLLDIAADQVSNRIRHGTITTICKAGIDDHEGGFRLSFFHRNRRAQIEIDRQGLILSRTVIDFGDRPLPTSLRGPARISQPKQPVAGNRS